MRARLALCFPATPGLGRATLLVAVLLGLRLAVYLQLGGGPAGLCQWDCLWYMHLAGAGYDLQPYAAPATPYTQANWVFFPVFPLLVRGLAALGRLPDDIAGLAVANLAFAAFVLLAARYLARLRPGLNQSTFILFLLAFPYGFYFSVPYTESLYAALTMAVLYWREGRHPLCASLAASVLAATRVTGFLLLPVLGWDHLAPVAARLRAGERRAARDALLDAALPLAIAPLGLVLFMAYLHSCTGDALAFIHGQAAWGDQRPQDNPLAALADGLMSFDIADLWAPHYQSHCFDALCGLAGLALALRLVRLRRFAQAWFLAATMLLAVSAGVLSLQRYSLANPVFLVFLFDWFCASRLRRALPGLLLAGLALQLVLIHFWGQGYASLD